MNQRSIGPSALVGFSLQPAFRIICRAGHCLGLGLLVFLALQDARAAPRSGKNTRLTRRIEEIVRHFKDRLGISQEISVLITPRNPRLISVEPVRGHAGAFQLLVDENFLSALDGRDLNAAIAHEMGHVWIYTHFPYLQTESGANEQALKLVSREDLASIYKKVWNWNGEQGSLTEVLGPNPGQGGTLSKGPAVFVLTPQAHSGISGGDVSFKQSCPECRITADRKAADYVVAFDAPGVTSGEWIWAIHHPDGTLLKKGKAPTLKESGRRAALPVLKHSSASKYPPAEPEALRLWAPQRGLITKAVNGHVYEHVHVNDHGLRRRRRKR